VTALEKLALVPPTVRTAKVGTVGDWVESGLSDHAPVCVELEWD
jgi:hypothetical protein